MYVLNQTLLQVYLNLTQRRECLKFEAQLCDGWFRTLIRTKNSATRNNNIYVVKAFNIQDFTSFIQKGEDSLT